MCNLLFKGNKIIVESKYLKNILNKNLLEDISSNNSAVVELISISKFVKLFDLLLINS